MAELRQEILVRPNGDATACGSLAVTVLLLNRERIDSLLENPNYVIGERHTFSTRDGLLRHPIEPDSDEQLPGEVDIIKMAATEREAGR